MEAGDRKLEGKGAAPIFEALDLNIGSMPLHNQAHIGKPDTCTVKLACRFLIHLIERIKYAGLLGFVDADAVILDSDFHPAFAATGGDFNPVLAELKGIVEQLL
jgi:hypothetical protein